ncbi:MAG: hypothetical protein Q4D58_07090 [Synergistaceae bacterium]|nr:hypothetical protein [Synergistaceae bacterium]
MKKPADSAREPKINGKSTATAPPPSLRVFLDVLFLSKKLHAGALLNARKNLSKT